LFDPTSQSSDTTSSTEKPDYKLLEQKAIIPLHIYQTWHTKNLPPKMRECVDKLKRDNPEFTHNLYDDADCREFIRDNFEPEVLDAFDKMIPGAYKADLWRYCILYKKGGIYLDIKFQCQKGFKLLELCDKNYLVLERPFAGKINIADELNMINSHHYFNNIYKKIDVNFWQDRRIGIYNAVMVSEPQNPLLWKCIQKVVKNVNTKYYGYNPLYITGPGLLGDEYFAGDYSKIREFSLFNSLNGDYIINRKGIVLSQYPEYRQEQTTYSPKQYYQKLWHDRKVYA
jgi:mannosyltransferase OCH1-like enzyme